MTILEASDTLAADAMRAHFYESLLDFWKKHPNCKVILRARSNGISEDGVTYIAGTANSGRSKPAAW